MSRKSLLSSVIVLSIVCFFLTVVSCLGDNDIASIERSKISLRNVGHQLLLSNQDSSSLVLPVIELEAFKYELSFQQPLSFDPDNLVSIVDSSFQKLKLPRHYRVEVVQVKDQQIAYSYEMDSEERNTIIPCGGRLLPKANYTIEVNFKPKTASFSSWTALLFLSVSAAIAFFYFKRKKIPAPVETKKEHKAIGSFKFYPEQSKLVKQAVEIGLSKKECELLEIFIANPNQIIKRDELTKRVWEDNGVFVGRSLDTYISKLRKKLKEDDTIKLTNVHGIGYKLVIG